MYSCPHCHAKPVCKDFSKWQAKWSAECPDCGLRGPLADTKEEAIELWNSITMCYNSL